MMCRFFFDVMDQGAIVRRDLHGRDLPSLEAAEIEASVAWKDFSQEWVVAGKDTSTLVIPVYDVTGMLLAMMPPSLKFWRADKAEYITA